MEEEAMPRDNSKEMKQDAFGVEKVGVFNPEDYQTYSHESPMIVGVYRDGIDIRHVTLRNFEPGQESALHIHPENAHWIYVLEGEGLVLTGEGSDLPIKAGQFLIVPRDTLHGLRNTGKGRLSYLGVNAGAEPEKH